MDPFGLVMLASVYVAFQAFAIMRLEGVWLRAAVLPVPVLCALLIASVSLGLFGVNGAEIGAVAAVPLGIVYLGLLLSLAQIARLLRPSPN